MSDKPKYTYPPAVEILGRKWPSRRVETAPIWCSVDLRDGNQALPNPMHPEQKLEYFQLLCGIGFKHIEVAFPSASQDDFDFTSRLASEGHLPADLFVMGLTQCREHLIARTFEAFADYPRAIVHAYIATSELHMKQVFKMTRAETVAAAVRATEQVRDLAAQHPGDIRYQFSPEEFTDTDIGFAVEICEAVLETWGRASPEKPLILNLPATVERRPPTHYADMVELFCRRFSAREKVLVSLHSHNDQGMAVASSEMALCAGADRVEGTLFGHGERTGNVDLVTMANNLAARGIETGLDFSGLDRVVATVEKLTGMAVYYRQPYAGEYVFTAFSGSHQDAIRKGMRAHEEGGGEFEMAWKVPYLHIDPHELGREYQNLIRINSQSGKGGVAWVLEREYGFDLPKAMMPQIGAAAQHYSDRVGREVTGKELYDLFMQTFVHPAGPYELVGYWPHPDRENPTLIHGEVKLTVDGKEHALQADGNGPVSAFVHAIQQLGTPAFVVNDYHEQAIGKGEDAQAVAYVPLKCEDGSIVFGVGMDTNIDQAAVRAILAGLNRIVGR